MRAVADPEIVFTRLTDVDLEAVRDLLAEPRNARHLPLAGSEDVSLASAAAWVAAKDGQWDEHGFGALGLTEVLIALPYSRRPDRVVARYGFRSAGEVTYAGVRFRQYRLTRAAWSAGSHPEP